MTAAERRPEPSPRSSIVDAVAAEVAALPTDRVARVAVDGRDGAGKTIFADELALALRHRGRAVVRVSIDGFHHPSAVRYRQGRDSPEGFFLDSYDLAAFRARVLDAVAADGDRRIVAAVHDVVTDRAVPAVTTTVPAGGILLVDGIFLHRLELRDAWDLSVYLRVSEATSQRRCAARAGAPAGSVDPRASRYVGGQQLYHASCAPERRATIVVDNEQLERPRVVVSRATGG